MKKYTFLILFIASVWSSFSHSNIDVTGTAIKQGASTSTSAFTIEPTNFVAPASSDPCLYFREIGTLTLKSTGQIITDWSTSSPCFFNFGMNTSYGTRLVTYTGTTTADPTQTCKSLEGTFVDGFHNDVSDFCAIFGTTGGHNPEPLFCIATNISEIPANSGNFQHTVTTQSCTAQTGPTSPDDGGTDPQPPCTENCEPTDPPPTGGGDGSDIPSTGGGSNSSSTTVTGTQTDSQGNVTNISMTMEQDFTPVTTRQDETNQRLDVENQNSSTIIERLDQLISGNADLSEAIVGSGTDTTAIESKLDGIEGKLGEITDGFGTSTDGVNAAETIPLPDYETAINEGFDQITAALNEGTNGDNLNQIQNITSELTALDSIPALFSYAADNCTPIPFGSHSLDTCQHAPTIRTVLTWASYMLVIIFLFTSIAATLTKIRLT